MSDLSDARDTACLATQAQQTVLRIPVEGMAGSQLFASIARTSVLLFAVETADESGTTTGDFMRHIPLPFEVEPESVSASFEDGDLVLRFAGQTG